MNEMKAAALQARIESVQFVFGLDPKTPLPIDLAAPAMGKSIATFRSDVTRRPELLPRLTRVGGRVFVRVGDLLAFLDQPQPTTRKRGRPTKAEQIRKAQVSHA